MKAIQARLQEIPKELDSLYETILTKIDEEDLAQSLQLMQWICFAQWPLSPRELREAMAVDANCPYKSLRECQNSADYVDTDDDMAKRVRSLSGGLAEIQEYEEQQVAQFIHQSVNDYLVHSGLKRLSQLLNDTLLQRGQQRFDSSFSYEVIGAGHCRISRSCVRYLTMQEVLSCETRKTQELERTLPFLPYTITNWSSHAKAAESQGQRQDNLLYLFRWPSNQAIQLWANFYKVIDPYSYNCPASGGTLMHAAAMYGLLSVVKAIFSSSSSFDVDSKDDDGRTPLSWAAENGHSEVVKLLLEKEGIDLDSKDIEYGQTPLSWAAENGHSEVVKLLLEKEGIDLDSKDTEYDQVVQAELQLCRSVDD